MKTEQTSRPKIALIGISGYARIVLQSLLAVLESGQAELVAVTVINRDAEAAACRALEQRGCRIFEDYQQMLDECAGRIDLCIIPTGIPWHEEMCVKALSIGAHVLVEKPLSGDEEGGSRIVQAGEDYGRTVAVAFQNMYCPQVQAIKCYLLSGALGEIKAIQAEGSWPRDKSYYSRNLWAGRAAFSGRAVNDSPLNNAFSHMANLSLFFAGRTFEKCATVTLESGSLYRHFPIETYDTADIHLLAEGGKAMRWSFTHADKVSVNPTIRVEAEHGVLCWVNNGRATASTRGGRVLESWSVCTDEEARREMLCRVIAHAGGGPAPLCDARFALTHTRVISQIGQRLPVQVMDDGWTRREGIFENLRNRAQVALA